MKRALLCVAVCLIICSQACKSLLNPDEPAGRQTLSLLKARSLRTATSLFFVKGRVENSGNAAAKFSKITIYIRNSSSGLIAQDWTYVDDTDLQPNETSPFDVLFSDDNHSIRDKMDFSKTTWEIK